MRCSRHLIQRRFPASVRVPPTSNLLSLIDEAAALTFAITGIGCVSSLSSRFSASLSKVFRHQHWADGIRPVRRDARFRVQARDGRLRDHFPSGSCNTPAAWTSKSTRPYFSLAKVAASSIVFSSSTSTRTISNRSANPNRSRSACNALASDGLRHVATTIPCARCSPTMVAFDSSKCFANAIQSAIRSDDHGDVMMMMMGEEEDVVPRRRLLAQNASTRTPSTTVTMLMTMKMPDNDDVSDAQTIAHVDIVFGVPTHPTKTPSTRRTMTTNSTTTAKRTTLRERTTTSLLSSRPPRGE